MLPCAKEKEKKNRRLTLVLLLRADDLNDREVPDVTEPVLVTVSEGLADREAQKKKKRSVAREKGQRNVGKAYQGYRGRNH